MAKKKVNNTLQLIYLIVFFVFLVMMTMAMSNTSSILFARADNPKSTTQKQGWIDFMNAALKPAPTAPPKKEDPKQSPPPQAPTATSAPVQGGPACPVDKVMPGKCTCNKPDWVSYRCPYPPYGSIQMIGRDRKVWVHEQLNPAEYKKAQNDPTCDGWCVGKPVIYLYPQKTTAVHVSVDVPGSIFISDPLYPAGGWNVIAHPNGTLDYQGKNYSELYFESDLDTGVKEPKQGMIIAHSDLARKLDEITTRLGLIEHERQEFLDYWLPKLSALPAPYIFMGIVDPVEKQRIDHVVYNPQPDTIIEFIAYFKPLHMITNIEPLILPATPERKGFTAVEWGGTIAP